MGTLDLSAFEVDISALREEDAPAGTPLLLDPKTIVPSRWANRHERSFQSAEFAELKDEIGSAGVNVQPIKVRPLKEPEGQARYEVVFGHRRHRACLDLGLQVAAVVEAVDDQVLWAQMERENRSRSNLSPWEQGMMYRRALDAGLFPSLRQLAAAIGRSQGDVSNAIAIAGLPGEVVAAFKSPADIQFRFAKDLKDAVAKAPEAVMETAKALVTANPQPPAEVFKALTEAAKPPVRPSNDLASDGRDGVERDTVRRSNGMPAVGHAANALPPDPALELAAKLQTLVSKIKGEKDKATLLEAADFIRRCAPALAAHPTKKARKS